uniref:Cytochrome c oxidase subunit 3 n=1 Tax=Powellomyces hirtus TaxID=109895 RepID=A0A4P8NWK3_9FUNG|nr:cytochrome c oxidase subunit 3 [Powellomyces hirtus]
MNYSMRQAHPYHLVDVSPWPLLMSMALLTAALGLVSWLGHYSTNLGPALFVIILIALQWWRDVIREAKGGYHTTIVQRGLLIGFILFLMSEIMLFMSFFWAFFHSSLAPAVELGSTWPPVGIQAVDPWGIPLLGSCILLASGFVLTLGHHAFFLGNKDLVLVSMFFTVILGGLFLLLQFNEYYYSTFTLSDSVFGSVFYCTTGLHALHVIIGVLFLAVCLVRIYFDSFTTEHALGLDFAIWYWHLVDIIWLIVFLVFYYWGGDISSDNLLALSVYSFYTKNGEHIELTPADVFHSIDSHAINSLKGKEGIYYFVRKDDSTKGYVGSSIDIGKRIGTHANHTRYRFNKALNHHGLSTFKLVVLEYTQGLTKLELEQLEASYYGKLNPYYNVDEPGKYNTAPFGSKPVYVWDRNGNLVQEFISYTSAAEFLGIHTITLREYIYRSEGIKNEFWVTEAPVPPLTLNVKNYPIKLLTVDNKLVAHYTSIPQLANLLGMNRSTLNKHLKSNAPIYNLLKIEYNYDLLSNAAPFNDSDKLDFINLIKTRHSQGKMRSVIAFNTSTNEVIAEYKSVTATANAFKMQKGTISEHIRKGTKTRNKVSFRFKD